MITSLLVFPLMVVQSVEARCTWAHAAADGVSMYDAVVSAVLVDLPGVWSGELEATVHLLLLIMVYICSPPLPVRTHLSTHTARYRLCKSQQHVPQVPVLPLQESNTIYTAHTA